MTANIEVKFFPSLYCTDIVPLTTNPVISKENTGPLDFDKEGVDCTNNSQYEFFRMITIR